MTDIKFGFHYGRIHEQHSPADLAPTLESMGFDSVWLAEGLVNERPMHDIMMAMSAFVHHSQRLTVGAGVVLLPLRHPALLAKQVASLDRLSGGRIILGVGVGGPPHSNPASYEVMGVKLSERGARTDESLEVMIKLWRGEAVSHHGRFHQFDDICMTPTPLQQPHPPLWAGGMSSQMLRRTARWCDGFIPVDVTPRDYQEALERITAHADELERDVGGLTKALHLFYRIGRNRDEIRASAERTLNLRRGFDVQLPDDGRFGFGTPSDCARTIEAFAEIGVSTFVFNPLVMPDGVEDQLEKLAKEILPRFK